MFKGGYVFNSVLLTVRCSINMFLLVHRLNDRKLPEKEHPGRVIWLSHVAPVCFHQFSSLFYGGILLRETFQCLIFFLIHYTTSKVVSVEVLYRQGLR